MPSTRRPAALAAPASRAALALALAALAASAARAQSDARPADRPATRSADTAACRSAPTPAELDDRGTVLVTLPAPDGEAPVVFRAWGVELRLDGGAPAPGAVRTAGVARGGGGEVHLTRVADGAAAATSRLRAAGQRLATVWVAADSGAGALRVRLTNVTVAAQRLAFPEPPDALDEQAAALSAEVCQLAAERADAARRLTELEALDRRKLAAAFELARLGDQGRVLDARLAAARRRLALLATRAARAARATEELTLRAERAEVLAGDEGRAAPPAAGR